MRELTICGKNVAEYKIVLKQIPLPAEKTAASLLQKMIEATCGISVPIADSAERGIYIGTREASPDIKWDGFRTTTDDKNVYLDGNQARGTLYAAYDFVEKYLGYRRFTADCEVIPTEGSAEIPCNMDVIDNPTFEIRRSDWYEFDNNIDFAHFSRLNTNPTTMPGLKYGEELGGAKYAPWDCHALGRLVCGHEYFKEHPEYYALVNGERIPCYNGGGPGQPCLTNPDVLKIVTEKVLQQLRDDPELTVVEVSQCDNHNFCTCEKCAAIDAEEESHSGTMIRFVNAVAEEVEKEFPYALISTFAYEYTRVPPKHTKARHNVIVRYCTYDSCFRHPINDPNCPLNRETTYKEMIGWQSKCEHMNIWDYVTNWDSFLAPYPNLKSLRENMRFYDECHVMHVFAEDDPRRREGGVFYDLKSYLVAKLMWNAYMTEEEYNRHIEEFLKAFYGKGWREIKRYMDLEYEVTADRCFTCKESVDYCFIHMTTNPPIPRFKQIMRRNYVAQPYQPMYPNHVLCGLVDRMGEAQACFDRAYALAETDVERERIERGRIAIDYVDLFCSDRNEFEMSPDEQAAYMARVEKFYKAKEKYKLFYNNHTSIRGR